MCSDTIPSDAVRPHPPEPSDSLIPWLESKGDLDDFIFFFEDSGTPSER